MDKFQKTLGMYNDYSKLWKSETRENIFFQGRATQHQMVNHDNKYMSNAVQAGKIILRNIKIYTCTQS